VKAKRIFEGEKSCLFLYCRHCGDMFQPQNILLTNALPDGDIKLCDFGLARSFNSGDDVVEIVGTLDYVGESSSLHPCRCKLLTRVYSDFDGQCSVSCTVTSVAL